MQDGELATAGEFRRKVGEDVSACIKYAEVAELRDGGEGGEGDTGEGKSGELGEDGWGEVGACEGVLKWGWISVGAKERLGGCDPGVEERLETGSAVAEVEGEGVLEGEVRDYVEVEVFRELVPGCWGHLLEEGGVEKLGVE